MERIRSFIAIELPLPIRAELGSLQDKLKAGRQPFVKWVDPEGIHLTLKFLGGVDSNLIPEIIKAMSRVAEPAPPFSLQLGGLGVFPGWQRPQVVWVGMGGEVERLASLQKEIESGLSRLGFAPESRPFRGHLTLGRLREQASPRDKQSFGAWVQSVRFESKPSFEVQALSLMKSQLTPSGAIYTQLACAGLGGRTA
ncbi:MAG: RNA 2',3'-cyclic phosphodiesterase [Chloroflexi bacterium]|nr:RNA 2',3'-cyclic phosphodiesterase [Chloroflexota bacterium]